MNILVIGNGFDIAHGLKTSYRDFLRFVEEFREYHKAKSNQAEIGRNDGEDMSYLKWLVQVFKEADKNEIYKEFVAEFHILVKDNLWLKHFNEVQIADGWVDFEKEISRIIRTIDTSVNEKNVPIDKNTGNFNSNLEADIFEFIRPYFEGQSEAEGRKKVDELKSKLLCDLNKLTRALEMYLSFYIEDDNNPEPIQVIHNLRIDHVLSFNYTSTFETVYGKNTDNIEYDYIHGRAKKTGGVHNCNLVLGIDEYQRGDERDVDNHFIEFKKFYQRIFKRTGSEYKQWLASYKEQLERTPRVKHEKIQIYFYGHSLDVTDKDILRDLIQQQYAQITIFYHDRNALAQQISNLVKVLSEKELIEKTGGCSPSIIFKTIGKDEFDTLNTVKV